MLIIYRRKLVQIFLANSPFIFSAFLASLTWLIANLDEVTKFTSFYFKLDTFL